MEPNSQMPADKRSLPMTTAAIVLSIAAASTVCCFYSAFLCGILGIIFALLSKGGERTMSKNAKAALYVSIAAVVTSAVLLAGSFGMLIMQYGSFEAFWKAYMEMAESLAVS